MTRTRARFAPLLGLALLLPLSACGGSDDPETASASTSASADADVSTSASPSASASGDPVDEGEDVGENDDADAGDPGDPTSSDAASPEATPAPAPGLPTATSGRYGRLLTASELPGLDEDWAWSAFETVPREDGPFTLCQRVPFSDIGATGVVVRRFDAAVAGADGDNAGELVATFPDAKQARQARSVLESWAGDCTPLDGADAEVSDWTRVQVANGTGAWYAVTTDGEDPERARTERVTVVQRGTRVAVVRSERLGRPREYPATQDPAELTAAPAASKLAR